jgi:hypothetical protein
MRRSVPRGWKDISSANQIEDTGGRAARTGATSKGRTEKRVEEDKAQEDLLAFADMYGSLASGSASSSAAWINGATGVAREFHDTGLESQIEATRTAVIRDAILARPDAVVPALQATPTGTGRAARGHGVRRAGGVGLPEPRSGEGVRSSPRTGCGRAACRFDVRWPHCAAARGAGRGSCFILMEP